MFKRKKNKSSLYLSIWLLGVGCWLFFLFTSFSTSSYYTQNTKDFFSSGVANQELSLASTNPELLNATVFHYINLVREEKGKTPFQYSEELHFLAKNYIDKSEGKKFTNSETARKKFLKNLVKEAKQNGFKGTLLNINAVQNQALNYNGKEFFYNKKDASTELHLFYGMPPTKVDKIKTREAIPLYTYEKFAKDLVEVLLKNDIDKIVLNKAYKFSACALQWDYTTLYKKRIPQIKLIQITGGFQTDLME